MLVLPYLLGFSYYVLVLRDQLAWAGAEQITFILAILQLCLWIFIVDNRDEISPYHVFFGSFLGLVFSRQSLSEHTALWSDFFAKDIFVSRWMGESNWTKSKLYAPFAELGHWLDPIHFYWLAALLLILCYFFIGDLLRQNHERNPNSFSMLLLSSPLAIYSFWYPKDPQIFYLAAFALVLFIGNPIWRSLVASLLLIVHPVGAFFVLHPLHTSTRLPVLQSLVSFLPLPLIALLLLPAQGLESWPPEFLVYFILAPVFALTQYALLYHNERLELAERMAASLLAISCLILGLMPQSQNFALAQFILVLIPVYLRVQRALAFTTIALCFLLLQSFSLLQDLQVLLGYALVVVGMLTMGVFLFRHKAPKTYKNIVQKS